jgi:rubrerythrin
LEAPPGQNGPEDEDPETKRRRILEETRDIDADSDDSDSTSSEEESDEEDETAELMRELEKIKREKAEKKAKEVGWTCHSCLMKSLTNIRKPNRLHRSKSNERRTLLWGILFSTQRPST